MCVVSGLHIVSMHIYFECCTLNTFILQGMLSARGEMLLFADADGATEFADIKKLETALHTCNVKEVSMIL